MNGESASASENLDQDVEQIRSEGKGQLGTGKWQNVCVCVYMCVRARVCLSIYGMCVATWQGEYERCQAGFCSSAGSVN